MPNDKIYEYEKYFLGFPVEFQKICFIYPSTVRDVVVQKRNILYYRNLLVMDNMDVQQLYKDKGIKVKESEIPDPLTYLLNSAKFNPSFFIDLQAAFFTFIKEDVDFLFDEKIIIIGNPIDKRIITEKNFPDFQNEIRAQGNLPIKEIAPEDETPMEKKYRLNREKREFYKKRQNQKKEDAPDIIDLISSLCALGIGITPFNVQDLTLYALHELLERTEAKMKFEQDIAALLAGADSKKVKPEYWIRNLRNKS